MYQVNAGATQVNILPEQLLLDYFETMSRLPLSQQVDGACTLLEGVMLIMAIMTYVCDTVESSCIMLQVPKGGACCDL